MPSVCPSSEKSRCLSSVVLGRKVPRDRSRRRSPRLPAKLARLIPHLDAAESFIGGWLARFHGEYPGRYKVLAARRTEVTAGGERRRVVVEAARLQPQRRRASPEWLLIYWCIDGPGVVFYRCPTEGAALRRLTDELTENGIVFSLTPAATDQVGGIPRPPAD